MFNVPYTKVSENAKVPEKANKGDAGLDLFATESKTLYLGVTEMVGTGISIAVPYGYCGFVLPRSSMGRRGIIIPNSPGLIDSGYRGEVKVLLLNLSDQIYKVEEGDKIGQLLIMRPEIISMDEISNLPPSVDERGAGGFGSSGK